MSEQEDKLSQELQDAALGKQVLDNPVYKQAMILRKAQIFELFCDTTKDQGDIREEAWRTMKNMDALQQYLEDILTTGKMAKQTLDTLTPEE